MNILLININPLVSRLLLLCTRDEHMILEEVEKVNAAQRDGYDIVFVDDASYKAEVADLFAMLEVRKKVFLSTDEEMNDFDVTIQKPFLPSQITEVLESIDEVTDRHKSREILSIFPLSAEKNNLMQKEEQQEKKQVESTAPIEEREETATKVLDSKEIEKIKALLGMQSDEPTEQEVLLSDEEYSLRKVELIKEQRISDGLEIVDEEEMIDEISSFKSILTPIVEQENTKKRLSRKNKRKAKNQKKSRKRKKEKKKKNSVLTKKEFSRIKDAITGIITNMKEKKMKKLLKGKKIEFDIKLKDNK